MVGENTFRNRRIVITNIKKEAQIFRSLFLLKMFKELSTQDEKEIIEEFFKASPDYIFLHGKWHYKPCFTPKPLIVIQL